MGVPSYFRWLSNKYSKVVIDVVEEEWIDLDLVKVPPDASQPNPNGIEYDNLYLDMNGIIHPCSHPENQLVHWLMPLEDNISCSPIDGGTPQPRSHDEIINNIFNYLDRIFCIVRPRRLLFLAIDGVAPRAKMNQQRIRRFRSAKEAQDKLELEARVLQENLAAGRITAEELRQAQELERNAWHFDSNSITPGTEFMDLVARSLIWYVYDRLNSNPGWRGIQVIISDASTPGEGEHKIMEYIRNQHEQPLYDPNTKHVLYGLDADLIMLGLATHEAHFTLLRELVTFNRPNERARTVQNAPQKQVPFQFLRIYVLREYLAADLFIPNLSFDWDLERALDDYVFLCFFVGNDFLPHMPILEIREGAIDLLVELYKKTMPQLYDYLTDRGEVNLPGVELLLKELGHLEDEILKKRLERDKNRNQSRQNPRSNSLPTVGSSPITPPRQELVSSTKNPNPSQDLLDEVQREKINLDNQTKAKQLKLEMKRQNSADVTHIEEAESAQLLKKSKTNDNELSTCASSDGSLPSSTKEDIQHKLISSKPFDSTDIKPLDITSNASNADANLHAISSISSSTPNIINEVRLGEEGWKGRYYASKFKTTLDDVTFLKKIKTAYIQGLIWVLRYYYQGCCSWDWYFPYHYAPFASDLTGLSEMANIKEFESGIPFAPFEQLMSVLPASSKNCLPEPYHKMMTSPDSPIIDFYPTIFEIDMDGKHLAWQGVVLLNFIDQDRLLKAIKPIMASLSLEETKRNSHSLTILLIHSKHPLASTLIPLIEKGMQKVERIRKKKPTIDSLALQKKIVKKVTASLPLASINIKGNVTPYQDTDESKVEGGTICGKVMPWLNALEIGQDFPPTVSTVDRPITNNQVLASHFELIDQHGDAIIKFQAKLLLNVIMPPNVLTSSDLEQRKARQFGLNTPSSRILSVITHEAIRNGRGYTNNQLGSSKMSSISRYHPYSNPAQHQNNEHRDYNYAQSNPYHQQHVQSKSYNNAHLASNPMRQGVNNYNRNNYGSHSNFKHQNSYNYLQEDTIASGRGNGGRSSANHHQRSIESHNNRSRTYRQPSTYQHQQPGGYTTQPPPNAKFPPWSSHAPRAPPTQPPHYHHAAPYSSDPAYSDFYSKSQSGTPSYPVHPSSYSQVQPGMNPNANRDGTTTNYTANHGRNPQSTYTMPYVPQPMNTPYLYGAPPPYDPASLGGTAVQHANFPNPNYYSSAQPNLVNPNLPTITSVSPNNDPPQGQEYSASTMSFLQQLELQYRRRTTPQ